MCGKKKKSDSSGEGEITLEYMERGCRVSGKQVRHLHASRKDEDKVVHVD